jgi:hypothetical protein
VVLGRRHSRPADYAPTRRITHPTTRQKRLAHAVCQPSRVTGRALGRNAELPCLHPLGRVDFQFKPAPTVRLPTRSSTPTGTTRRRGYAFRTHRVRGQKPLISRTFLPDRVLIGHVGRTHALDCLPFPSQGWDSKRGHNQPAKAEASPTAKTKNTPSHTPRRLRGLFVA